MDYCSITFKDPKLWDLRYIPYYGKCRSYIINRISLDSRIHEFRAQELGSNLGPPSNIHNQGYCILGVLIKRILLFRVLY